MSDEAAVLEVALLGNDRSLETTLTRGLAHINRFVEGAEQAAGQAGSHIDRMMSGAASLVKPLTTALNTLNTTLDRVAMATAHLGTAAGAGASGAERQTAAVSRLAREYRAGLVPLQEYKTRLQEMAASAEQGSDRQIAALARLRRAEEQEAQEAKRLAAEKARALRAADVAVRQESRESPGGRFAQAAKSSRFALPGTNGNIMPLIGQTIEGGAAAMAGMAVVGAASAVGGQIVDAVHQAEELEETLNVLQAQTGATDTQLDQIRTTARALGADMTLPATSSNDAGKAMLQLASDGLSLQNSLKGARGSLLLAAAAETDAGTAAHITASWLNAYEMSGDKATKVADLLAAASNNGAGPMIRVGEAGQQAAAVFHMAGFSALDLATSITMMGRAGIQGSDAGTSLKTAVERLIAPTQEAGRIFDALQISIYDNQGKLLPYRDIIERVSDSLVGLTEKQKNYALQQIFGTDAIRAATIVIGAGAEKYDDYSTKVDAAGAAAKRAEARMKGLKGAQEGFNSALDTFKERHAAPFLGFLTGVVNFGGKAIDTLDSLIDRFNQWMSLHGGAVLSAKPTSFDPSADKPDYATAPGYKGDSSAGLRATIGADTAQRNAAAKEAERKRKKHLADEAERRRRRLDALMAGKGHGGGGEPHIPHDVTLPETVDISPVKAMTTGQLAKMPTDATTYGLKREALDAAYTQEQLWLEKAGQATDTFAQKQAYLAQQIALAAAAIKSTDKALAALTPKVETAEAAMNKAGAALDRIQKANAAKKNAGGKLTEEDAKAQTAALNRFDAAKKAYETENRLLQENLRIKRQATEQEKQAVEARNRGQREEKNRQSEETKREREKFLGEQKDLLDQPLDEGGITRLQYEQNLKDALARIGPNGIDRQPYDHALKASEKFRANAARDLHYKMLGLDKKDFDASRERVGDEAKELGEKGLPAEDIEAYRTKSLTEIGKKEFESNFKEADEAFKTSLDMGRASLTDYRAFLVGALEQAKVKFGETSIEASKMADAIAHVDWQAADQQATRFKEALDAGNLSLPRYIAEIQALRATLPATSSEYKKLTGEIDAANKKIHEDTKRKADAVAGEYASAFMRILHGSATVGQVVKETIHKAIDTAIEGAVKRWVSGILFRFMNKGNEGREEAEKRRLADQALQTADLHKLAADTFVDGVNTLATTVDNFGAWVQQFGGGGGGGGGGGRAAGGFGAAQTAVGAAGAAGAAAAATGQGAAFGAAQTAVGLTQAVIGGRSTAGGVASGVASASAAGVAAGAAGLAAEVAKATKGGASRDAARAAAGLDVAASAASGDVVGAGMKAASAGWLGKAASQVVPWLGIGLTAATLLGGLFGHQKPDYVLHTGEGRYSQIGSGDHSGLIDSGYSGIDSLRRLQTQAGARADASAGQRLPTNHTLNIHPGAIVINAAPNHSPQQIANMVYEQLAQRMAIDNALTGRS